MIGSSVGYNNILTTLSRVFICNPNIQTKICSFDRLPDLRLNRCFVAPSTIAGAGNGVFASRDIAEGELVTLFPGDAVLIQDSTAEDSSTAPVGVMFGSHVKEVDRDTSRVTSHEARSYEFKWTLLCLKVQGLVSFSEITSLELEALLPVHRQKSPIGGRGGVTRKRRARKATGRASSESSTHAVVMDIAYTSFIFS
jgi:hypothetical protein